MLVLKFCLFFLLYFLASSIASRGIRWSTFLHPDELPISRWIDKSEQNGYIRERIYPSGWFVLMGIGEKWDSFRERHSPGSDAWKSQDGMIAAVYENTFHRRIDCDAGKKLAQFERIQRGRDFNVILLAISSILIYLALLQIGCNPFAAFFSGLLLASHPFFLEHAHYCETDMALVVSLAAYALAASCAVERKSMAAALAASFIAGFGVASKYTLTPILVTATVLIAAVSRKYGRWRKALACCFAIGGLLLFALGFLWGTPALYKDPSFYLHGAVSALAKGTYSEATGLSSSGNLPSRFLLRASSLVRESWKSGWPLLAWSLASLGFWFSGPRKKHLAAFPLFLPAFLLFALFGMPWIRNQELLPVLAVLVFSAALPIDSAIKSFNRGMALRQAIRPCATILLGMLVLASVARDGFRMTSAFLHRETRAECQNWLFATAPSGLTMGASHYAAQVARGVPIHAVGAGQLEERYSPEWMRSLFPSNRPSYYLRDSSFAVRANRTHVLNRRTARAQECFEKFNKDALRLKSWTISPGRIRPIFAQHDVELWALPPDDSEGDAEFTAPDIPVLTSRPVFFRWAGATYYASWELGPFGPEEAIQTVGKRRWVRPFSETQGRFWAVSRIVGGRSPVTISWNDLFTPSKRTFPVGHATFFEGKASRWKRLVSVDSIPGARVRMRGDDQNNLCLTTVVSDPAEAAFLLRSHGEPGQALGLLRKAGIETPAARIQAFLAASEARETPEAAWIDAARMAIATYDATIGADTNANARICGVPLRVARDFARLRFDAHCRPDAEIPVYLPPGKYSFTVKPLAEGFFAVPNQFFAGIDDIDFAETTAPDGQMALESSFTIARSKRLRIDPEFPETDGVSNFAEIEIRWDPLDSIAREIEHLRLMCGKQQ